MVKYQQQVGDKLASIVITNCEWEQKDDAVGQLRIMVDDRPEEWTEQTRKTYLPGRVVVATTGREDEWVRMLRSGPTHGRVEARLNEDEPTQTIMEKRALGELSGMLGTMEDTDAEASDKVTLIPAETLPLVTLCALLAEYNRYGDLHRLQSILDETKITQVCGFSLTFRLNEGITPASERREIERLQPLAIRAVHTGSDRHLYFDLTNNPEELSSKLFKILGSAFAMYNYLRQRSASTVVSERMLQGVDIFVRRGITEVEQKRRKQRGLAELPPTLQLLSQFSDGERSFLGRMSLFSMLSDQPSLVLLDEPEVHFNDFWKRQIVLYLHEALNAQQSHALITTHSSITLTDVPKEDVLVLYREHTHTEQSTNPSINTLAADPSDIMVHVFQAPYATGQHAINKVQEIERMLTSQRAARTLSANDELEANNLLAQLGAGYWRYQLRRALYKQDAA